MPGRGGRPQVFVLHECGSRRGVASLVARCALGVDGTEAWRPRRLDNFRHAESTCTIFSIYLSSWLLFITLVFY